MENFWDSDVWGSVMIFIVLLASLLVGNIVKKATPFMQNSLIPTSVIGGGILIIVAAIYKAITGDVMFDTAIFGGDGTAKLEIITYHTLALGFIASAFKSSDGKLSKKRVAEIFNTGVTTVSTYLIQAIAGLTVTLVAALVISGFFKAAGILLPFGYGQGTGQAMNYGNIYETQNGFGGGKSFGLTIAALGFLSASFGGVIHLNIMKKRGNFRAAGNKDKLNTEVVESENEIPMQESIDKMTVQIALIFVGYALSYILMYLLGLALPGMKSTVYGFNFLLTRCSNFFFDVMVVAGIAAIRLDVREKYWGIMLILGVVGLFVTYTYNRLVAVTLFKDYPEEQFLAMYGMLTGTASTGIILLREIDGEFKTPAADNLVYQNFPAIVFGFPIMLLANLAPYKPELTLIILIAFFLVMNIILFRSFIFRKKKK